MALTIITFYGSQLLYKRFPIIIFTPILVSTLFVILFLKVTNIEYQQYYEANHTLNFLLGVSVVCIGYLMYKEVKKLNKMKLAITVSTFIGSIVGVLSIIGFGYLLGYEEHIMLSLEPKSVTMPIALSVSENAGGIPAITSFCVVLAGIFGNVFGERILKFFKITDPASQGLALGAASHAVGTARAAEMGALTGAVSGAAIGIMGLFTSFVLPIINAIINLFQS